MLAKSRADKRTAKAESALFEGTEAFMPDDGSVAESTSTWGMVNMDATDMIDPNEDPRSFSSRLPWAISKCPLIDLGRRLLRENNSFREWRSDSELHRALP